MKFKIGDMVKIINNISPEIHIGDIGKIIGFSTLNSVCIEFNKDINGHAGEGMINGHIGKSGHCWFISPHFFKNIKLQEDKVELTKTDYRKKDTKYDNILTNLEKIEKSLKICLK